MDRRLHSLAVPLELAGMRPNMLRPPSSLEVPSPCWRRAGGEKLGKRKDVGEGCGEWVGTHLQRRQDGPICAPVSACLHHFQWSRAHAGDIDGESGVAG
jgi:hypothetical protein